MPRLFGIFAHYSSWLFLGYLTLFLVRHVPLPYPGVGILVAQPFQYLESSARFNPLYWLNLQLGPYQLTGVRIELLLVWTLLFGVYFLALHRVRSNPQQAGGLSMVLVGVALFSLPLVFLPYLLSQDVHAYIMQGRIAALYGHNPSLVLPADYPQDPYLPYLWSEGNSGGRFEAALYGPVWTLLSHGLTLIVEGVGGTLWLYLLAYKLVALAALLASILLIWSLLGRAMPDQQIWGTLLYAWNPLVLIEFVGSAHNDALMVALVLLALWFAQRDMWRRAVVMLTLAALVKWIPVILLSLYGWLLVWQRPTWRSRVQLASQVVGIVLGTSLLLYAPYGLDLQTLGTLVRIPATKQSQTYNSWYELILKGVPYVAKRLGIESDSHLRAATTTALRWLRQAIVLILWLAALHAIWRRPTFASFTQWCCWSLLGILLFATSWFWPWYVTWPLALAALMGWGTTSKVTVAFTASAAFFYIVCRVGSMSMVEELRSLFIFLPVLALLAYPAYRHVGPRVAKLRRVRAA